MHLVKPKICMCKSFISSCTNKAHHYNGYTFNRHTRWSVTIALHTICDDNSYVKPLNKRHMGHMLHLFRQSSTMTIYNSVYTHVLEMCCDSCDCMSAETRIYSFMDNEVCRKAVVTVVECFQTPTNAALRSSARTIYRVTETEGQVITLYRSSAGASLHVIWHPNITRSHEDPICMCGIKNTPRSRCAFLHMQNAILSE